MRITIDTDDDMMKALMRITGEKTKSGAVRKALTEWVEQVRTERARGSAALPRSADQEKTPDERARAK